MQKSKMHKNEVKSESTTRHGRSDTSAISDTAALSDTAAVQQRYPIIAFRAKSTNLTYMAG